MRKNGFTLIELIVVIVVFGILTSMVSATFFDYYHTQILQTARDDLIATLNLAKSNSLSQVKSPTCSDLGGYKVVISSSTTYTLNAVCTGTEVSINTKTLPQNIAFTSTTPASFLFKVLTGGVVATGPSTITLSGFGKTRNITVSSTGVIQ